MNNFYYIQSTKYRFNRYMVECELKKFGSFVFDSDVLIDTWWNVNRFIVAGVFPDALRFNRYMVECELEIISDSKDGF